MMIASGNDAALALAEYNGGSMEKFVRKMNDRAKNLGLNNTHYTNPMGFDHENNYSTAEDLSLLSLYVLQNDFLTTPANLEKYEIESRSGISHEYVTTNQLLNKELNIPGVVVHGLKTGRTPDAGECLISVATDDKGHEIMTVVLGSQERFQDTQKLIEWVYTNYRW
jgi:D-alanyl-D-alanine carboxypeptidase